MVFRKTKHTFLSNLNLGLTFRLIGLIVFVHCSAYSAPTSADPSELGLFPEGLINFSPKAFDDRALMVDKTKKKIYLFKVTDGLPKIEAKYDADLGKNSGDKIHLGDSKTPEGVYFFEKIIEAQDLDQEKYGVLAFTTNYPNFFDKRIGKSGNGIWLHAIADKTSLDRGSRGCVVVRNDTIKLLRPFIKIKYTPLMVYDQIKWISKDNFLSTQKELNKLIQDWKSAWEGKKLEEYFQYYAKDFKFKKMNLEKYKEYKKYFATHYSTIKIKLSEPQIFEHNGDMIVRFLQDYSSPEHSDFGVKVLYMQKQSKATLLQAKRAEKKPASTTDINTVSNFKDESPSDFKIIGEFWEPLPEEDKSKL